MREGRSGREAPTSCSSSARLGLMQNGAASMDAASAGPEVSMITRQSGWSIANVLHQANIRIIDTVAKDSGIDREKFFVNIQKYGNTSSASVPLALDEAVREGKIKKGDKVLMLGFGGGLSWGGIILEWQ